MMEVMYCLFDMIPVKNIVFKPLPKSSRNTSKVSRIDLEEYFNSEPQQGKTTRTHLFNSLELSLTICLRVTRLIKRLSKAKKILKCLKTIYDYMDKKII